jgi:hypothetical protein
MNHLTHMLIEYQQSRIAIGRSATHFVVMDLPKSKEERDEQHVINLLHKNGMIELVREKVFAKHKSTLFNYKLYKVKQ